MTLTNLHPTYRAIKINQQLTIFSQGFLRGLRLGIQVQGPPRNILTLPVQISIHLSLKKTGLKRLPCATQRGLLHLSLLKPAGIPLWCHSQETLLFHLSYPKYCPSNVNAHIPPKSCSLQYIKVDHTIAILQDLGLECFMSKLDIKSTFRNAPVHPSDWELPGIKWEGFYFFNISSHSVSDLPSFFLMNSLLLLNGSFELKSIFPRLIIY